MRSIDAIERENNVQRLRPVARDVPAQAPSEIWDGVHLLAAIVADGVVRDDVHYKVRVKLAGQLPLEGISDEAQANANKVKDAAHEQIEAAVLGTPEFQTAAELGKQLDAARIAHDDAKAMLATAKAERDAVTSASTDDSPAVRSPEEYAAVVAGVEKKYLAADEQVKMLEKKTAIFAAYLAATEARYNLANQAIRTLRQKHTMFAGAAPLAACRERRSALSNLVEEQLRSAARELFEISLIESAFSGGIAK